MGIDDDQFGVLSFNDGVGKSRERKPRQRERLSGSALSKNGTHGGFQSGIIHASVSPFPYQWGGPGFSNDDGERGFFHTVMGLWV